MRFKIQAETLIDGLSLAADVSSRAILKTSNGVHESAYKIMLKAQKDQIKAVSFGGRMAVQTVISALTMQKCDLKVLSVGFVTVNSADIMSRLQSFSSDQTIIVEKLISQGGGIELKISRQIDAEQFQTIQCFAQQIQIPDMEFIPEKTLKINRQYFLQGAQKVSFALGFQEQKPQFLYWIFRVSNSNKVRFAAGDNRRFAIYDLEGNGIVDSNPATTNVLFSKQHTPSLIKLLSKANDDHFTVKQSSSKLKSLSMVVSVGHSKILMAHMDPNIQWPNQNTILKADYDNSVIINASEWDSASKSISAAFSQSTKTSMRPQVVSMQFQFKQSRINVSVDDVSKMHKKVSIVQCQDKTKLSEACGFASTYLTQICPKGSKTGFIQIDFNNPVVDSDGRKMFKPFVFRFFSQGTINKNTIVRKNTATNVSQSLSFIIIPT